MSAHGAPRPGRVSLTGRVITSVAAVWLVVAATTPLIIAASVLLTGFPDSRVTLTVGPNDYPLSHAQLWLVVIPISFVTLAGGLVAIVQGPTSLAVVGATGFALVGLWQILLGSGPALAIQFLVILGMLLLGHRLRAQKH